MMNQSVAWSYVGTSTYIAVLSFRTAIYRLVIGTYMAPERLTGDYTDLHNNCVLPRMHVYESLGQLYKLHSDIWAFGVSLVELALGGMTASASSRQGQNSFLDELNSQQMEELSSHTKLTEFVSRR